MNWVTIRRLGIALVIAAAVAATKLAIHRVDNVVTTVSSIGETITLDEPTYVPLQATPEIIVSRAPPEHVPPFAIKNTAMNRRMQVINLEQLKNDASHVLRQSHHKCIHLKFLGVNADILVIRTGEHEPQETLLLANPTVIATAGFKNIYAENPLGDSAWAKLPTELSIDYVDNMLNTVRNAKFTQEDAFCLFYYIGTHNNSD